MSNYEVEKGNGHTTRFWTNSWLGGPRLCDTLSRLYQLKSNLECLVYECEPMPHSNSLHISASASISSSIHYADINVLRPGSLNLVSHVHP